MESRKIVLMIQFVGKEEIGRLREQTSEHKGEGMGGTN